MSRCHYKSMPALPDLSAAIRSFDEPALCGRMNWKYTSVHRQHIDCKRCLAMLAARETKGGDRE